MSRLRAEDGITLIEVLVAMLVLTVGIISLIQTFDSSRKLTLVAERRASIAHLAQREIERLESVPYSELALATAPAHSTESTNPDYYVDYSSPVKCKEEKAGGCFAWNSEKPSEEEPLAISESGKKCPTTGATEAEKCGVISASPTGTSCSEINPFGACEWTDGRLSGAIYDFVTYHEDTKACEKCTTTYKRVTVVVTVNVPSGSHRPTPVRVSTLIANPTSSKENPLASPGTKCGAAEEACTQGIDKGKGETFFLHDVEAEAAEKLTLATAEEATVKASETSGHATHATVESPGHPDFMDATPPTRQALYDYSNDQNTVGGAPASTMSLESSVCGGQLLEGTCYGGRRIAAGGECSTEVKTSTAKADGEMWVTEPLGAQTKLTGAGGLTLFTQTVGGVAAGVKLCVAVYDVAESLASLWSSTNQPTELGYASYYSGSWPTSMSSVGFIFSLTFPKGSQTIGEKHRIGLRIWPAPTSTAAISAAYDTESQKAIVQLNTE